jgi:hypothetical protein
MASRPDSQDVRPADADKGQAQPLSLPAVSERIGAWAAADARPDEDATAPPTAPHSPDSAEQPNAENLPETPEQIVERRGQVINRVVDAAGTDQVRLIMATRLAAEPGRAWTAAGVTNEINRILSLGYRADLVLPKGTSGRIYRYSEAFSDSGLSQLDDFSGSRHIYNERNGEEQEIVHAAGATMMVWQAENPEIPLQKVLGTVYRLPGIGSQRGHSSLRLAIAEQALSIEGKSNEEIIEALGEKRGRVNGAIRELASSGIVETTNKMSPEARGSRIIHIDPGIVATVLSKTRLPKESPNRAAWLAAKQLAQEGVTEITGREFLDRLDPSVDRDHAWKSLVRALANGRMHHLSLEPIETNVKVGQLFRQPLDSLIKQLKDLRTDEGLEAAKQRMQSVFANPLIVARLMAIERRQSSQ